MSPPPKDESVPLWRGRPFRLFWAGQTISQFGDRISELALPLIAVQALHASVGEVAALTALVWTPNLLAIVVGAWVEQRRRKRRVLCVADLVRAGTLLTLPVADLLGTVTMAQLYAVAVVTGAGGVFFNTAYPAFFAHLVPRASYLDANSNLSASRSASYVAGPAVGGALVQALTAPVAVLADALSFVSSAVLLSRIADVDAPTVEPSSQPPLRRRVREGLGYVLVHPVLRTALGCATTVNFFTFVSSGLIVLFASRVLALSAGVIGLTFGVGAVGALIGAVVAPAISRRTGIGRSIAVGCVLFPAPIAIAAAAGGPLWLRAAALAGSEFLSGIGVMLFDVNLNSVQTSVIPDSARSRVAGAFSTINYGIRPLGALTGGLLGSVLGLRPALLIAAVGGTLSVLWLLPSPIPHIRSLTPEDQQSAKRSTRPPAL